MVESASLASFATFKQVLFFVFILSTVENPFSQRYVVENDTNNFKAVLDRVGKSASCETQKESAFWFWNLIFKASLARMENSTTGYITRFIKLQGEFAI